jgi:sorting nexin-1/2
MQLDTEDGETFVPPAGVVASPTTEASTPGGTRRSEAGGSENGEAAPSTESITGQLE